ncbi:MAG TPA: SAM-dependent methyltransferase [Chloroflexi bacterium]|nr:SAM-dependent methyltransferase [Chloroflexota bacterium]
MLIDTFMSLIPVGCLVLLLAVAGIVSILWTELKGAPYVATPRRTARRMLELAEISSEDVVYDLGSGDGRLLWLAAQEFGARAVGVEIDPIRYAWTKVLIRLKGLQGQVQVIRADLFKVDLRPASLVTVYLSRETNRLLMEKLGNELSPGTRIVSRKYTFPALNLIREDVAEELYVYLIGKA